MQVNSTAHKINLLYFHFCCFFTVKINNINVLFINQHSSAKTTDGMQIALQSDLDVTVR